MPGLSDGNDAFFTFDVNFSSFTFTDNASGNSDVQVLFESGGNSKGVSLVLDDEGLLRFRSGGSSSAVTETNVDLTTSGLSTGVSLNFVAAFNASAGTLDLYLNESSKTSTAALLNTNIAGADGYGVGDFSGNPGTLVDNSGSGELVEAFSFSNGTISNFVVYDNLSEALATIPEPSALIMTLCGAGFLLRRSRHN